MMNIFDGSLTCASCLAVSLDITAQFLSRMPATLLVPSLLTPLWQDLLMPAAATSSPFACYRVPTRYIQLCKAVISLPCQLRIMTYYYLSYWAHPLTFGMQFFTDSRPYGAGNGLEVLLVHADNCQHADCIIGSQHLPHKVFCTQCTSTCL